MSQAFFKALNRPLAIEPLYGEVIAFCCILGLANLHLYTPIDVRSLVFFSLPVINGEWWLIFTHAFVHVSPYHLLLDAGAFLCLYFQLTGLSRTWRLALVCAGIMGSLVGALAMPFGAGSAGLCGLSGAAHGLITFIALQYLVTETSTRLRWLGGSCLFLVLLKSSYEAYTCAPALDWLHLGSIGRPLVWCHTGGLLAGAVMFVLWYCLKHRNKSSSSSSSSSSSIEAAANI
jgi:membrane associated rhomboid family serine protease